MGYTALYRKFRPINFSEMVGQEHITRTFRNQIISNRVGHAYLFNGGRGTGKTSAAKILARAINCLNPIDGEPCNECEICRGALNGSLTDIVEMDAASNNSVEDIRSIREEINFLPTKAKYRVYIIDEVHMLSTGAFNALLKTLEEPPEHVKFILATTEPQKLPATILSRCQRFDFKRISNEDIIKRLKIVCNESKIEITEGALNIIAVLAEGAMRDALSILERCVQDGENKIDEDKIKDLVGIPKLTYVHDIIKALLEYNLENAIKNTNDILNQGKDLDNFLWEMIKYVKDVLIYQSCKKIDLYTDEEVKLIKELSDKYSSNRLVKLIYDLSELQNNMKWSTQRSILFQAGMIKLCYQESESNAVAGDINERISKIENYLRNLKGNITNVSTNNAVNAVNAQENKVYASFSNNSVDSSANQLSDANKTKQSQNIEKALNKENYTQETAKFGRNIEESWPKIVRDLKQNGKIVLYTNLMQTKAVELNDMTVGIQFPNGLSAFGKTVLEKQENIREISKLVSIACGKEMQIKYIDSSSKAAFKPSFEDNIKKFADDSDIPFNIVE